MRNIIIQVPFDVFFSSTGDFVIHVTMTGEQNIQQDAHKDTQYHTPPTFFNFMQQLIERSIQQQRQRAVEILRVALSTFKKYREGKDIKLSDFTSSVMCDFEQWMLKRGLKKNSTSFYLRVLRKTYNCAVSEGLTIDRQPFVHVYTGQARTRKRALSEKEIHSIETAEPLDKRMATARDLFMFSFYTRGMSFVDMAYLKKTDLRDGILIYRRRKTGQEIQIGWHTRLQQIIDKHPSHTSYLLPIIRHENSKERGQSRHVQQWLNEQLHLLGERLGLSQPLTMYCARHSWATIAQRVGIPIEVISQGMGHDSLRTTQIYLKEIDCGLIDEANRQVIDIVAGAEK